METPGRIAKGARAAAISAAFSTQKEKDMATSPLTAINFQRLANQLQGTKKDVQKAVQRAINDTKTRAPAQVTKAVTAVYAIKSSEVTAAGKAAKNGAKTVGSIKVAGMTASTIQLVYSGRRLTPTHFSMTPRLRPAGNAKYKIKVAIKKGGKKELGSHTFLAPSGAAGPEIPFKRTTAQRLPIEAVKTLSIPQMIDNEVVSADIQKRIDDVLTKRLQHHIDRLEDKRS